MSDIETFQNLFMKKPENVSFLANGQLVEYDRNGLWLSVSEKYIFWKDIIEVTLEEENVDWGSNGIILWPVLPIQPQIDIKLKWLFALIGK